MKHITLGRARQPQPRAPAQPKGPSPAAGAWRAGAGQHTLQGSAWARATVVAAAVLIAAHGLIHLMGVVLLWRIGEPGQLRYADAVPAPGSTAGYLVGGLWLVAAMLFVASAILLAAGRSTWRRRPIPARPSPRARHRASS